MNKLFEGQERGEKKTKEYKERKMTMREKSSYGEKVRTESGGFEGCHGDESSDITP